MQQRSVSEEEGAVLAEDPGGEETTTPARKRRSLKPLLRLLPYLTRYKGMCLFALLALLMAACATLVLPMGVRRMIDLGFSPENAGFIDQYFAMMAGIGIVLAVASSARFYTVNWLGERIIADLRSDVFTHLTRLSPAFYDVTHSAEVMSRLTADTTQMKSVVGVVITQTLRNLVLIIGAIGMMFFTSVKLSAMVLAIIPLIILPLVAFGRSVRRLSRTAQDTLADSAAYASDNLSAIRTLQAYAHEPTVVERFAIAMERAMQAAEARLRARAFLTGIAILLLFGSIVGVLWIGAQDVLSGDMSGGRLGQFVLYAAFAGAAFGGLSEVWGELQTSAGAAERLSELLAEESAIVSPEHPRPLPEPVEGRIEFSDVTFAYPSRPEVDALIGASFVVEPGETVAIVGESGSGKSTVFSLLLRYYDTDAGRVSVDGVPVSQADLRRLRRSIALVPQETALFADTVAENIRYGASEASDGAIVAAARAAHAENFILRLPDGYDTDLGERGATLSGGQRQRIAIARAVLRDAPILLLDEATSALDAESETKIGLALDRVMEGRTTLIIAHRLATVQRADRILVMHEGRIAEQGTHTGLLEQGGIYARLAELQFDSRATL